MSRLTINSNVAALTSQRRLADTTGKLQSSFERLSSGLRINRASDDAAGLAIAAGLNADGRVLAQAVRNLNDGISLLNIADQGLETLRDVATRLAELSTAAANGIYGAAQRVALDEEARALVFEYNRIVETLSFNGKALYAPGGEQDPLVLQAGYGSSGALSVSLGQDLARTAGDGTFSVGATVSTGDTVQTVTLGDLNGDGRLDLVAGGGLDRRLYVHFGAGDGTFSGATSYFLGDFPQQKALADLDGDGSLDIIATQNNNSLVTVFLNNGDGTFQAGLDHAGGSGGISVADFDNDGNLDVFAGSLLLGNGDGTLQPAQAVNLGGSLRAYSATDLNNDGTPDLVTWNELAQDEVRSYLGNGDGTFTLASTYSLAQDFFNLRSLVTGDFNLDGTEDVAVYRNNSSITVLSGTGSGALTFASSYVTGHADDNYGLIAADADGDGVLDLIHTSGDGIEVRLGNGDGTFQERLLSALNGRLPVAGDINSDGALDLVMGAGAGNIIATNIANTSTSYAIEPVDLRTQSSARQALGASKSLLGRIAAERAAVGASLSRISTAIDSLNTRTLDIAAAHSRIVDVDVSDEAASLVRNQVLQQAGTAILAQANQLPALVLALLSGI